MRIYDASYVIVDESSGDWGVTVVDLEGGLPIGGEFIDTKRNLIEAVITASRQTSKIRALSDHAVLVISQPEVFWEAIKAST